MNAIRVRQYGGPDVLRVEEARIPVPGDGQALIKLRASGVNFIDIYHRMGLYQVAVPFTSAVRSGSRTASVSFHRWRGRPPATRLPASGLDGRAGRGP